MSDDNDNLIRKLQAHTPLGRLSLAEARVVIAKLGDLGTTVVPIPADPPRAPTPVGPHWLPV